MIGFEDLGGVVAEIDNEHVTVTYFAPDDPRDIDDYAQLVIDGGDKNFAAVKLNAEEVRRLINLLGKAHRRLT
jgi:hypothetical protein